MWEAQDILREKFPKFHLRDKVTWEAQDTLRERFPKFHLREKVTTLRGREILHAWFGLLFALLQFPFFLELFRLIMISFKLWRLIRIAFKLFRFIGIPFKLFRLMRKRPIRTPSPC